MLRKRTADELGLARGHLYWVPAEGGRPRDLGKVEAEDAKLLSYVVREIGARVKTSRVTSQTLSRARALSDRIYAGIRS